MTWLLDTNILSELRRRQCNPRVRAWVAGKKAAALMMSVMSLAEIRRGIEMKREKDPRQAEIIELWLARLVRQYSGRILTITEGIADRWGRMNPNQPASGIDSFIAATALVHGFTVATRNTRHFERTGVPVVNPFEDEDLHA